MRMPDSERDLWFCQETAECSMYDGYWRDASLGKISRG